MGLLQRVRRETRYECHLCEAGVTLITTKSWLQQLPKFYFPPSTRDNTSHTILKATQPIPNTRC
jgi:hypothetical protein